MPRLADSAEDPRLDYLPVSEHGLIGEALTRAGRLEEARLAFEMLTYANTSAFTPSRSAAPASSRETSPRR